MQYSTTQHSTAQRCTAQHSIAQHSTVQQSTAPAQHSTIYNSAAQCSLWGMLCSRELWEEKCRFWDAIGNEVGISTKMCMIYATIMQYPMLLYRFPQGQIKKVAILGESDEGMHNPCKIAAAGRCGCPPAPCGPRGGFECEGHSMSRITQSARSILYFESTRTTLYMQQFARAACCPWSPPSCHIPPDI